MEPVTAVHRDALEVMRQLADVTVRAMSPDGLVVVGMDGWCRMTELELDPRVYRRTDSRALAAQIAEANRAATQAVAERARYRRS
jgi:DNA-binding protein YbaB